MSFKIIPTTIPDVLIIEPQVFFDARGAFYESFNAREFSAAINQQISFVQDNHSLSKQGVIRGFHYQIKHPQGKLVRVVSGAVFDVAIDLRQSSPYFGKWVGTELSSKNNRQHWIPPGFAHGFLVLSKKAELLYKVTDYWELNSEQSILWNDPTLKIEWPLEGKAPILSSRDARGLDWIDAPKFNI
jgi:dTDP-4-dehydrorhamnose 3,5-epimerase